MSFFPIKAGVNLAFDLLNGNEDVLMDVIKGKKGKSESTFPWMTQTNVVKESLIMKGLGEEMDP